MSEEEQRQEEEVDESTKSGLEGREPTEEEQTAHETGRQPDDANPEGIQPDGSHVEPGPGPQPADEEV